MDVDVWFRRVQIVFWVQFVELGGLLTPSVTKLSFFPHLASTLWRPNSLQPLFLSPIHVFKCLLFCFLPLPLASLHPGTKLFGG